MTTKHQNHKLNEARDLLDKAQKDDDIFGKTARSISHWVDKYCDYGMAWHKGILFHLESWVELGEVSTVVRTYSPETATAISEFLEYHRDL